jgi:hypothetical protein
METNPNLPVQKSTFISVFAWIMIFFNGFGVLISLLQNVMMIYFYQFDEFKKIFSSTDSLPEGVPTFLFSNIRIIIPVIGVLLVFAFVSSIGLLNRKEWARKAYLFLLGFGILYFITGTIYNFVFTRSVFKAMEMPPELSSISALFLVIGILFSLGFFFLLGWLYYRLSRQDLKEEFK